MAKKIAETEPAASQPRKRAKLPHPRWSEDDENDAVHRQTSIAKLELLGLPAELRNRIWRCVLVEEDEIELEPGEDATQPGLLRVNCQIREETRPIYCEKNSFLVTIQDLIRAPHQDHWVWNLGGDQHPDVTYEGMHSWTNLQTWLLDYWKDPEITRLATPINEASGDITLVSQMFDMVNVLKAHGAGWGAVESMITAFRRVLDVKGAADLWDE